MTNCSTRNECLEFPDGDVHPPDDVNASESDEPADEPVSESPDSCNELSFLSQRQCRLINQQLRKSDSCIEESISALMHGSCSDGRPCVLEVCAARDSPPLHDISVAERRTSRDHDLSKTRTKVSRILNWRDQSMPYFSLLLLVPVHNSPVDDEATKRNILSTRAACCFDNSCLLEMRMSLLNVHLTL